MRKRARPRKADPSHAVYDSPGCVEAARGSGIRRGRREERERVASFSGATRDLRFVRRFFDRLPYGREREKNAKGLPERERERER